MCGHRITFLVRLVLATSEIGEREIRNDDERVKKGRTGKKRDHKESRP